MDIEQDGPVLFKELTEAYEEVERLNLRLVAIKARIEELNEEEEDARTAVPQPKRTGFMALLWKF